MLITRTDVKSGPCHRCNIIRSFVLFTSMLIILALVGGDRLAVIDFLTPAWFATAIIAIGVCGFLVKLISWKIFNKQI
jgi:disulfide bond formation protein DsbB